MLLLQEGNIQHHKHCQPPHPHPRKSVKNRRVLGSCAEQVITFHMLDWLTPMNVSTAIVGEFHHPKPTDDSQGTNMGVVCFWGRIHADSDGITTLQAQVWGLAEQYGGVLLYARYRVGGSSSSDDGGCIVGQSQHSESRWSRMLL